MKKNNVALWDMFKAKWIAVSGYQTNLCILLVEQTNNKSYKRKYVESHDLQRSEGGRHACKRHLGRNNHSSPIINF